MSVRITLAHDNGFEKEFMDIRMVYESESLFPRVDYYGEEVLCVHNDVDLIVSGVNDGYVHILESFS